MSLFPSAELKTKLAFYKKHRQRHLPKALWRSAIVITCTASLLYVSSLPCWQIAEKSQIKIIGNNLVSPEKIQQILDFTYPQFIWSINNGKLSTKLAATPSIAAAKVSKQILPSQLTISLQAKYPVAIALRAGKVGFVDRQGAWIDSDFYGEITSDFPLPQLKLINFTEQNRSHWLTLYNLISRYSVVEISEVRWDKSGGIFLQGKIGSIYLGSDLSRLNEQFKIIVHLSNLPDRLPRENMAYIDLSNPDANLIQKYQ